MIKAIIFDLDDTLISELEYVKSGFNSVASYISERSLINKHILHNKLISLFELDKKNVFNRLFEEFDISYTNRDIISLVEIYRSHSPNIKLLSDVLPCLSRIKNMNIRTGIITDGYSISQNNKLKAINAKDFFDRCIVTDELGKRFWKPHPKPFEIMQEYFKIEFDEMVYVGDNPEKDFYISNIFPITTVRINRNGIYANANYKDNIKEDYCITSLDKLDSIIKGY